ncbi:AraC family transcriptional regulator [Paenibacillus glycanilyticus]|nr:AraC family transcriptional regulator [Paenibacillus glycanilyticus]
MAAYSEKDVGWNAGQESSEFYRFMYVLEGNAVVTLDGQVHHIEPNRLYLIRPKTAVLYEATVHQKLKAYWCNFSVETGNFKFIKMLKQPVSFSIPIEETHQVIAMYQQMIEAKANECITTNLKLKAAILQLFCFYMDRSVIMLSRDPYFETLEGGEKWTDVIDYIENNLHHNIQIEDLAKVAYLHPNYLITSFKTVMGCSPIQYVTERRLERAKKLLRETNLPISEIAGKVGMLSHYLPRLLKRQTGVTPKDYRRIMKIYIPKMQEGMADKEVKY